jgi:ribosome-associated protein
VNQEEDISKSRRKRNMHELQDLGEALSKLSKEKILELELPSNLEDALLAVKSMNAHGAIRRQMQYIGRLMRDVDAAPIRSVLDRITGSSREAAANLHRSERWRDRMLEEVEVVDEFVAEYPAADRAQLRSLVLAAQREWQMQKPPRRYRELFRLINQFVDNAS